MRRTTMPQLLLMCFAALLLAAVLISERANRTVLSTAVLFLLGGFVLGKGMLGVIDIRTGHQGVAGPDVDDTEHALAEDEAAEQEEDGCRQDGAVGAFGDQHRSEQQGREAQQEELGHRRPSHGAGWSVLLEDVLGQADLVTLGADDPPSHRSMISGSRSVAQGRPASAACRLPVVWNAAVRGVDDREPVAMSPGVKPDESPARRTLQLRSVCGRCSILARGMGPGTWVHSRSSP